MTDNVRVALVAVTQLSERKAILDALRTIPGLDVRVIPALDRITRLSAEGDAYLIVSPDQIDDFEARHANGLGAALRQFHIILAFRASMFFEVFRLTGSVDGWLLTDRPLDAIEAILNLSRYGYVAVPAEFKGQMDLDGLRLARIPDLSYAERQLLLELAAGKGNQQVAEAIGLTGWQAKSLIRSLFKYLQFRNRTEAAVFAATHQTEIQRIMN
jgi:DNA-binding CsgD family transcriptional regulator